MVRSGVRVPRARRLIFAEPDDAIGIAEPEADRLVQVYRKTRAGERAQVIGW